MSTETMTLQVPMRLYADLTALAAEEQTNLMEVLTHLVTAAYRQKTSSPVSALRQRVEQTVVQPETPALVVEVVQRSLGLSAEQWNRLQQDLPSALELSQTIGQCLTSDTHLSAEILAMREA